MAPDERERRRAIKSAYRAEYGGALMPLDRLLEDEARRARLRGPYTSLGFALAQAGAIETCRTHDVDPGWLLDAMAGEGLTGLLWRALRRIPLRSMPIFPLPSDRALAVRPWSMRASEGL